MKEQKSEEIGGVILDFSYSVEMAEEYLKMGFYLGIGGVVTFKNAKKIKEVVQMAPMERILLETDSPYLHRSVPGKRNSSLYLPYVVQEIAELKGISEEEVIETNRKKCGQTVSSRGIGSDTRGVSSVLFVRINSVWPDKLNRRKRKWLIKQ